MRDSDLDGLIAQANALAPRVNALLQNKDCDVALAVLAKLLSAYLLTLPIERRDDELHDWLRLVRAFTPMGGRDA